MTTVSSGEPSAPDTEGESSKPRLRFEKMVSLKGTWQRDWRLGREVVGAGSLHFTSKGVRFEGRVSNPIRGLVVVALRVSLWVVNLSLMLAVLLTSVGASWRAQSLWWLVLGPLCVFPFLLSGGFILRKVAHRWLEPWHAEILPWENIGALASDGKALEVELQTKSGRVFGHFRPRRRDRLAYGLMKSVREGNIAHLETGEGRRGLRSLWVDRSLTLGAMAGVAVLAARAEPYVSAWWMSGGAVSGPLAGIPDALTESQVETMSQRVCAAAPAAAPTLSNHREGADLVWEASPSAEWSLMHLRWEIASNRVEFVRAGAVGPGREKGFFQRSGLGISLLVPAADGATVQALVATGRVEALMDAWCAGLIGRADITSTERKEAAGVIVSRAGQNLEVRPGGLSEDSWLLPVRRRHTSTNVLFDTCEVPQAHGTLGLVRATPTVHTLEDFFVSDRDEAVVYLIADRDRASAEKLARNGTIQPCMVVDSLRLAGATLAYASTRSSDKRAALEASADREMRMALSIPVGASAQDTLRAVDAAHARVWQKLAADTRPSTERARIMDGVLDAVPWDRVLDNVSFSRSLARLEVLRQSMDGRDPDGQAGDRFLFAIARHFMYRRRLDAGSYNSRISVGEEWLGVKSGKTWVLDGRTVRVPAEAEMTYQTVGRFVLLDVGLQLETHINNNELSFVEYVAALAPRTRLALRDITIDVRKSSKRKALEAWVQGNWEYILDRVLKKASEKLKNQEAAVARIRASEMSLSTQWSDGDSVRMSDLRKARSTIGWVALFDPREVKAHYTVHKHEGVSASTLPGPRQWLITSGTYANLSRDTSGLAVQDGRVVNYLITPKQDGLVIVDPELGVHILDMRRGGVLPGTTERLFPLRRIEDFSFLLRWLNEQNASAFQTHLLYSEGEPRIDAAKASPELRERRVLVEAEFKGHPIVAVVDLPSVSGGYSLYEAMAITERALQTPNSSGGPELRVIGIANLDVGAYDILQAYDARGTLLRHGPRALSTATNLLTFTP